MTSTAWTPCKLWPIIVPGRWIASQRRRRRGRRNETTAPGPKDGSRRPARRRGGARLQQPARGHPRQRRTAADGGDQLTADTTDCLKQIIAASERAANLTRQLLAFSRKQVMQSQPLVLNEVIANLTKMLKRIIGEHIRPAMPVTPTSCPSSRPTPA